MQAVVIGKSTREREREKRVNRRRQKVSYSNCLAPFKSIEQVSVSFHASAHSFSCSINVAEWKGVRAPLERANGREREQDEMTTMKKIERKAEGKKNNTIEDRCCVQYI